MFGPAPEHLQTISVVLTVNYLNMSDTGKFIFNTSLILSKESILGHHKYRQKSLYLVITVNCI